MTNEGDSNACCFHHLSSIHIYMSTVFLHRRINNFSLPEASPDTVKACGVPFVRIWFGLHHWCLTGGLWNTGASGSWTIFVVCVCVCVCVSIFYTMKPQQTEWHNKVSLCQLCWRNLQLHFTQCIDWQSLDKGEFVLDSDPFVPSDMRTPPYKLYTRFVI